MSKSKQTEFENWKCKIGDTMFVHAIEPEEGSDFLIHLLRAQLISPDVQELGPHSIGTELAILS